MQWGVLGRRGKGHPSRGVNVIVFRRRRRRHRRRTWSSLGSRWVLPDAKVLPKYRENALRPVSFYNHGITFAINESI